MMAPELGNADGQKGEYSRYMYKIELIEPKDWLDVEERIKCVINFFVWNWENTS